MIDCEKYIERKQTVSDQKIALHAVRQRDKVANSVINKNQ